MKTFLLRILIYLLSLSAIAATKPESLGFDPTASNWLERVASIYIAPESEAVYRLRFPNGEYRGFDRGFPISKKELKKFAIPAQHKKVLIPLVEQGKVRGLMSPGGWSGLMFENKGTTFVYIMSGDNVIGGAAQFLFVNGRLTKFEQQGKDYSFQYDTARPLTDGGAPYYEIDVQSESAGNTGRQNSVEGKKQKGMSQQVRRELKKKWSKSGRLRWPFENPNENGFLYLSLALLSTVFFLFRRLWVKIVGGVCFTAASIALVMTASRGSFLAFACGLVPAIALNFKKLTRSKGVWILAGVVLLSAVGWFATHDPKLLMRGFSKSSRWSNETRIEMWKAAPQMMAEAPGGWGGVQVNALRASGRAYSDWYDSLSSGNLSATLVNDHLTWLVLFPNVGRYTYLFVWFAILALAAYTALRTKRAVALGMFVGIAVAGWFNAVLANLFLWSVPIVALILFVAARPWRVWRRKPVVLILVGSALAAGIVLAGLLWLGSSPTRRGYPIYVVDGQVRVKDKEPDIWIVDDDKALGTVFACDDIRKYYMHHPSAPAVGYVRSIDDLPKKVKKLVLAGDAAKVWAQRLQQMVKAGEDVAGLLPEKIVFITPPFQPPYLISDMPDVFKRTCKVHYLMGEFFANYMDDIDVTLLPSWVTVVPGMELYVENWMDLSMKHLTME